MNSGRTREPSQSYLIQNDVLVGREFRVAELFRLQLKSKCHVQSRSDRPRDAVHPTVSEAG